MWHSAVAPFASHDDFDLIHCCHHRPGTDGHLSWRQPRPVVQGVHLANGKLFEQTFLHHDLAATAALLGRLEDHESATVEVPRVGEISCGAQQHGGVAVMSAGMHAALVRGFVRYRPSLVHRQTVHVGTQADRLATVAAPVDDAYHSSLR